MTAAERLVLQSIVELQGAFGKPVPDLTISQSIYLKLEDVRNILQILQEKEMVSLVFTERGLVTFIEAKGRLELSQLRSFSEAIRRSPDSALVRVSVAGLTGTGKSLLINTLIGANVMNVVSIFPGTIEIQRHQARINNRKVQLTDCPGLGSGQKFDNLYFELYKQLAAESELILWTVRADTRVVSLDERYFEDLRNVASEHRARVVIALTYCDRIQPGNWDSTNQCPDEEQSRLLELRSIYLSGVLQVPPNLILKCSSIYGYGIESLRNAIAAPHAPRAGKHRKSDRSPSTGVSRENMD